MHNDDFGPTSGPGVYNRQGEPEHQSDHSILSLVILIVGAMLAVTVALAVLFWVIGFIFGIAGLVLRVGVLAAVAALVWRRVTRHRSHKYGY